jgi:precorrin-6B C5,15-methyltransferase / cobalt-precorrin-6B C5,C15-methyltransferase
MSAPMRQTATAPGGARPVVHVIGIGEDGAAGLGAAQLALIAAADLLCGGERHLAFFPDHAAERFTVKSNIDALATLLRDAPGNRRAVVLASGDPCFFGIAPLLAARLGGERVCVHPQTSSAALAFNRLGLAWQDAPVLSAHGRPLDSILARALAAPTFAVLTEPTPNTPAAVAAALIAAGMEGDAPAWVCERLGGSRERIVASALTGLLDQPFDPLNVLVVRRKLCPQPRDTAFGLPDDAYASLRGQISKSEVRAVTLAKLEPWRAAVAWDVGAGSGALAIELAGLMPAGRLYAIERAADQVAVLRRNLAAHPRPNVVLVPGAAPAALTGLPGPNAAFIGGGGSELEAILPACYRALNPGGRLVANFAQIESLTVWQAFARAQSLSGEIVQLQAARGVALGEGTRLAPQNPVFITSLHKPESDR